MRQRGVHVEEALGSGEAVVDVGQAVVAVVGVAAVAEGVVEDPCRLEAVEQVDNSP